LDAPAGTGNECHDIVQWIACYNVLGKAFFMEGWASAFAESLVTLPDPAEAAIKVTYGDHTFLVSRDAKNAMADAVDALKNRPTLFGQMAFVMCAVSKILQLDTLQHTMPQSQELLDTFDWNKVIPGRQETYPKAEPPTNDEYRKVRTVHELVKQEKDEAAQKAGWEKSGVQACTTLRQRWSEWREIHSVHRYMNKSDSLQTVADRVKFRLKLCTSWEAMQAEIREDVEKHIASLKRKSKQQEQANKVKRQIAAAAAAAEEAEKQKAA
jgi:DNA repair ATPase RecN